MMTDGPEAEVGDVLDIPFERPRNRAAILADPRYQDIRNHLLTFLNERSHIRPSKIRSVHSQELSARFEPDVPANARAASH
jgi:hypothetical protein